MNSDQLILQVQHIEVRPKAKDKVILACDQLGITRSEILGITGESGSGKSTFLRVVSGSIFYDTSYEVTGSVQFQSSVSEKPVHLEKMDSISKKQRHAIQVSLVPQEPVASFSLVHTIDKHLQDTQQIIKPEEALNLVGLNAALLNRYPGELSIGQMQRIAIAAALCTGAELILMDEPGASLDQIQKKNLIHIIKTLNQSKGISFVIVSHQMDFIREICTTLYEINQGRLRKMDLNSLNLHTKPDLSSRSQMEQSAQDIIIQTQNLGYKYPDTDNSILHDISIVIHRCVNYGIMGVSGGGKSTLGRILCGLDAPSEGTITFNGKAASEFTVKEWKFQKRKIQYLWQDALMSLNPAFTAENILHFCYENYKNTDSRLTGTFFEQILDDCGITKEMLALYPIQLSGGQRQRINLAKALLAMPDIIIADEPFSAIDDPHKPAIYQLFNEISARQQIGLILISHDAKDLIACCDQIIILDQGHIIENGDLKNIVKNSTNSVTKQLIDAS